MGWEASNVFQVLIITSSGSGQGLFVYTGPPGANNLSFSVTAANGTDPFGNVTVAGATAYKLDAGTGHWWAISENTGTLNWYSGTTNNQTTTTYSLQSSISGTGSPDLLLGAGAGGTVRTQGPFAVPSGGASVLGGLTADTEAISSGQAAGLLQTVTNTTSGATGSLVRWIVNAAGDVLLGCRVAGDTVNRITLTITAGGLPQISFGPGAATPPDTFIYRSAAALLASSPIAFNNAGAAEVDQVPTFANSWATAAGRAATTYRRIAIKDTMEWVGSVTVPTGFVANQNMTTANPAAYQPVNNQSIVAIDTTNDNIVRLTYLSTGVLQFSGPAASTAVGHVLDIPCQQIRLTD